jgi:hypothetical protein
MQGKLKSASLHADKNMNPSYQSSAKNLKQLETRLAVNLVQPKPSIYGVKEFLRQKRMHALIFSKEIEPKS